MQDIIKSALYKTPLYGTELRDSKCSLIHKISQDIQNSQRPSIHRNPSIRKRNPSISYGSDKDLLFMGYFYKLTIKTTCPLDIISKTGLLNIFYPKKTSYRYFVLRRIFKYFQSFLHQLNTEGLIKNF